MPVSIVRRFNDRRDMRYHFERLLLSKKVRRPDSRIQQYEKEEEAYHGHLDRRGRGSGFSKGRLAKEQSPDIQFPEFSCRRLGKISTITLTGLYRNPLFVTDPTMLGQPSCNCPGSFRRLSHRPLLLER